MRAKSKRQPAPLPEPPREEDESLATDEDVMEFVNAIDVYKRKNARLFPNWSEVLGVLKALGYRKDKKSA